MSDGIDLSDIGPFDPLARSWTAEVEAVDPADGKSASYALQIVLTTPQGQPQAPRPLVCLINGFQSKADWYRCAALHCWRLAVSDMLRISCIDTSCFYQATETCLSNVLECNCGVRGDLLLTAFGGAHQLSPNPAESS